jgi:hypothetical protein
MIDLQMAPSIRRQIDAFTVGGTSNLVAVVCCRLRHGICIVVELSWRLCSTASSPQSPIAQWFVQSCCNMLLNGITARVHLDVYTAMTGASRFGQLRDDFVYSKDESLSRPEEFRQFTHLLTHTPEVHAADFDAIDLVKAFHRAHIAKHLHVGWLQGKDGCDALQLVLVRLEFCPAVWIMQRRYDQ